MPFGDIIQVVADTDEANSISVTLSSPTSGNLLVACFFTGFDYSPDPTESGWTEANVANDSGNDDEAAMHYKLSDGTETTVTYEFDQPWESDEVLLAVVEIEGPFDSSPLDQTAKSTNTGAVTSGTTATTSQAQEIAVALITGRDGDNPQFSAWTNSFTEQADIATSFKSMGVATRTLSATGTYETSATLSTTAASLGIIATFKGSGGGGGEPAIADLERGTLRGAGRGILRGL